MVRRLGAQSERFDKVPARSGQPQRRNVRERRKLFPLPEGERQGEWERGVSHREAMDLSRECGTLRVLRLFPNFMSREEAQKARKLNSLAPFCGYLHRVKS